MTAPAIPLIRDGALKDGRSPSCHAANLSSKTASSAPSADAASSSRGSLRRRCGRSAATSRRWRNSKPGRRRSSSDPAPKAGAGRMCQNRSRFALQEEEGRSGMALRPTVYRIQTLVSAETGRRLGTDAEAALSLLLRNGGADPPDGAGLPPPDLTLPF